MPEDKTKSLSPTNSGQESTKTSHPADKNEKSVTAIMETGKVKFSQSTEKEDDTPTKNHKMKNSKKGQGSHEESNGGNNKRIAGL